MARACPVYRDELVRWSRQALARLLQSYGKQAPPEDEMRFTFLRPGPGEGASRFSDVLHDAS